MNVFQIIVAVFASFMFVSCSNSSDQLAEAKERLETAKSMLKSWMNYQSQSAILSRNNSESDDSNDDYPLVVRIEWDTNIIKEAKAKLANSMISIYQCEVQEATEHYESLLEGKNEKNQ